MGKVVLGTEQIVGLGRDLKAFGAGGWGIREVEVGKEGGDAVVVSVVGRGVGNVGRKIA